MGGGEAAKGRHDGKYPESHSEMAMPVHPAMAPLGYVNSRPLHVDAEKVRSACAGLAEHLPGIVFRHGEASEDQQAVVLSEP